jgi:hypothetical protein
MILKGMGMKAGVPDILLAFDGHAYFLELKAGTYLSEAQKATHEALRAAKCPVAVVRSLDEFRALVAGAWWPLQACIRESKPATERIKRGMTALASYAAIGLLVAGAAVAGSGDYVLIVPLPEKPGLHICAKSHESCEMAREAVRAGWFLEGLRDAPTRCEPDPNCFSDRSNCIPRYVGPRREGYCR